MKIAWFDEGRTSQFLAVIPGFRQNKAWFANTRKISRVDTLKKMIIHETKIETKDKKIRVSSYIEVETRKEYSDTLWYEFEKEYEPYISDSSNGFITAVLFLAMYVGEDIVVKGKMSPKLAYGLKGLQNYFNFWYPEDLKIVKISCEGYETEKTTPEGVMSTFSGGVDSFHTLYQHLPENEDNPHHQITHCLLIDGFALRRNEERNRSYQVINENYEKLTRKLGIELVFVVTNLSDFYQGRLSPARLDGPVLTSVPLILGRLVSVFHIASCLDYSQILPRGSNAITNHMLSTEKLTVTIHGSEKSRVEKTLAIANWSETYDNLRVCWNDKGVNNCCRCEKCVRTMITLDVAGVLSRYKTFPLPLKRSTVRSWELFEKHNFWFAKEIIDFAKKNDRKKMVFDIRCAMVGSTIKRMFFWAPSAALKKRSKTYRNFVKRVKAQS